MYSKIDDLLALAGFAAVIAGVYLLLGLPYTLILFGIVLIYIGAKIDTRKQTHEPNQTANTAITEIQSSKQ